MLTFLICCIVVNQIYGPFKFCCVCLFTIQFFFLKIYFFFPFHFAILQKKKSMNMGECSLCVGNWTYTCFLYTCMLHTGKCFIFSVLQVLLHQHIERVSLFQPYVKKNINWFVNVMQVFDKKHVAISTLTIICQHILQHHKLDVT